MEKRTNELGKLPYAFLYTCGTKLERVTAIYRCLTSDSYSIEILAGKMYYLEFEPITRVLKVRTRAQTVKSRNTNRSVTLSSEEADFLETLLKQLLSISESEGGDCTREQENSLRQFLTSLRPLNKHENHALH